MSLENVSSLDLETVILEIIQEEFAESDDSWLEPYDGRGVFGSALVVWLMLLQAMNKESMSAVLTRLQKGEAAKILSCNPRNDKAQGEFFSSSTGGLVRGKKRLDIEQVEDFVTVLNRKILRDQKATTSDGKEIVILDGTVITLEKSPELDRLFPPQTHEHGKLHHPQIRIVFASHGEDGVILESAHGPLAGKKAASEQGLSKKIIEDIKEDSVVLGDQNFGVFSIAARIITTNKIPLLRLTESRACKFFRDESANGDIDKPVTWVPSKDDKLLCEEDRKDIQGRFIRFTLRVDGFRPKILYFFTTSELPLHEIISIYGKRVDIETDIRYLKHTFNMERLYSKSYDGVSKELLIRVASHNLLRSTVAHVARSFNLKPRGISFIRAVRYILVFGTKLREAKTEQEQQILLDRFKKIIFQLKHPNRKSKRHEPRKLTKAPSKFPVMKGSRDAERQKLRDL
jgi:hypothetical protein